MKQIAIVGLSVMGSNLALNIADNGFKTAVYNRTSEVTKKMIENYPHQNIEPFYDLPSMVNSLEKPRKILLMVKAGHAVDMLVEQLLPLIDEGDIIIDGGNSYFHDTQRRYDYLKTKNIHYFGIGISGGEEGARKGPAIMPGGDAEAYRKIQPILEAIAAKVNNVACCKYTSTGGAGHYVKMVHNGIEYGDMQLIAESYSLLKHIGKKDNSSLACIFDKWNEGELSSYLIEITANIFKVQQDGQYLIDDILDISSQKGTGKWTNLEATTLGVDTSVITAALNARFDSTLKEERIIASEKFSRNNIVEEKDIELLVEKSLYFAKVISYAQGFKLLQTAEQTYNWRFNYAEIAKIFRGGCIIQAKLLQNIIDAYDNDPNLINLMLDDYFSSKLKEYEKFIRELVVIAVQNKISIPAFQNALAYFDSYCTANSNANLIQAQRDYFGAHTFEKISEQGVFHFDWVSYAKK